MTQSVSSVVQATLHFARVSAVSLLVARYNDFQTLLTFPASLTHLQLSLSDAKASAQQICKSEKKQNKTTTTHMCCLANQHTGPCPHADFHFNAIKYKLDSSFLHHERADPANAVHRRAGDLLN